MLVEWRPLARAQLGEILEYISDRNIVAASELYKNIEAAISALPQHPYLYRFGRVPGTREIVVHPNYLVVYRVTNRIEIVTVLHARQEYP
ncbi:type II toxin-antitoxin system RelE/ParE family toxin [Pseudomonas fragi]|uniref:type II toxin-antitoxin system RelE/ParE family toxin n=1 Tax=Pseudomonas fragi TaxID=296 RepID=UPI001B42B57A|nr:type II toxin-antitoxin system RelE/ParE family toxin [Pseudomonas fragi]MBP3934665.1 type II toxin-antitoxin system RelE/ParE family toxin [Pseudomonas sp.]MCF6761233.1 type II toxin-antitoxin system RelE/ParE family toxin [Pseudomonas fragi]